MGQARIFGQTAAGGSSGGSTLTVIAEEGSSITVAKGDKVLTSNETPAVFKKLEDGVWNATAEKEGKNPISQDIELKTNYTLELSGKIYGISRDITASSPNWTRTHDAVGFNATASVGTVPGESDFDNVYPWSEIHRETLSTGDVMVYIPKFYYQRYREGNIEYINIADRALDGFSLHPLFDRPDGERDAVYVGAYETSSNNKSVAKAMVQVSQTRDTMRNNARSKGAGWGLIDIAALSAIQMLILVEFATNDVQTAIGAGYTTVSSGLSTGYFADVPNLTGRPSGTEGGVTVWYRGIENPWGNYWEFVDGVVVVDGNYKICNVPSQYVDVNSDSYATLSYSLDAYRSAAYVKTMGFDPDLPHVMLPETTSGGGSSTYVCDGVWSSQGTAVFSRGGDYSNGSLAGLFATHVAAPASASYANYGSRLLYLP